MRPHWLVVAVFLMCAWLLDRAGTIADAILVLLIGWCLWLAWLRYVLFRIDGTDQSVLNAISTDTSIKTEPVSLIVGDGDSPMFLCITPLVTVNECDYISVRFNERVRTWPWPTYRSIPAETLRITSGKIVQAKWLEWPEYNVKDRREWNGGYGFHISGKPRWWADAPLWMELQVTSVPARIHRDNVYVSFWTTIQTPIATRAFQRRRVKIID